MSDTTPTTNGGTPLSNVNPIASAIDNALSDTGKLAEQTVDKAAEASQPWLNFPIIKTFFEALVAWVISILDKTGQLFATKAVTTAQGAIENNALMQAEKEVEDAFQSGDPVRIAKAEEDFQKAQSAAANTDGSAKPK